MPDSIHQVLDQANNLAKLLDDWPSRVWVKDTSHKFVYGNKATESAAGYDLIGKTDADIFDEPHANQALSDEQSLIAGHGNAIGHTDSRSIMHELETWKDGSIHFVETTRQLLCTDDGQIAGIFGMTRDLSPGERDDFLRDLGSRQLECPGRSVLSLPPIDDNAGAWWQKRNLVDSKQQPRPEFDETFLRTFPGKTRAQRFRKVAPADRHQNFVFLNAAMNAQVGEEEKMDFRYPRPGSGGVEQGEERSKEEWAWIRATRCMFQLDHENQLLVVTHRKIAPPSAGELLGRTLLSSFPGFIFVKDKDHCFRYLNDPLLKALRMKLADLLNESDDAISAKDEEKAIFHKGDKIVLSEGQPYFGIEQITPNETGKTIDLATFKIPIPADVFGSAHANPDTHEEHHILGVSLRIEDARLWRELRDSRLVYEKLISDHSDAIYLKEKHKDQFHYVEANDAFCKLTGKSIDKIIDHSVREVWNETNGALIEEMENQDLLVYQGGEYKYQNGWRETYLPSGEIELRSTSKQLIFDENGKPWRILGVSRDVTDVVKAMQSIDPALRPFIGKLPVEEREIVIIFCDIRGFSTLAALLSATPNVFIDFYQKFYGLIAHLSKKHGCIFDKLQGDGAMFITGMGMNKSESLSESACRAAAFSIELGKTFEELVAEWHYVNASNLPHMPTVRMGIGIHLGKTTAGILTNEIRTEFIAFGTTVNVAQRIESAAGREHGDVLVSSAVRDLIKHAFVCDTPKRIRVKDGSVFASEVRGRKSEQS